MILNISGATQAYLANLDRTQQQINQASGRSQFRLPRASAVRRSGGGPVHSPDAGRHRRESAGPVQPRAASQPSSRRRIRRCRAPFKPSRTPSRSPRGANSTATAASRAILAQQVAGLQQTLVGISNTNYNGRYIFSGDQTPAPAYQLDSSQPDGVQAVDFRALHARHCGRLGHRDFGRQDRAGDLRRAKFRWLRRHWQRLRRREFALNGPQQHVPEQQRSADGHRQPQTPRCNPRAPT